MPNFPKVMTALCFEHFGATSVLSLCSVRTPVPIDETGVLVRVTAAGLNFADVYRRRGEYSIAGAPPHILGYEGAGYVVSIGSLVQHLHVGQRVGFADVPFSNAEYVSAPEDKLIALPDDISDIDAASLLLQGLTAQYLTEDTIAISPADRVVVHAAAGGVGRLIIQFVAQLGAEVIAIASTAEKRQVALEAGAITAIDPKDDWVGMVMSETSGGATIVYDSIGSTLEHSLAAIRPGGRVVLYGKAGGEPPPIEPFKLALDSKGIIGGDLWTYLTSRVVRQQRADRLFDFLREGAITRPNVETFSLFEGARAHARLEDRTFFGKIVMTV